MFDGEDDVVGAEGEAESLFPRPETDGFFELEDWMAGAPGAATKRKARRRKAGQGYQYRR